MPLQSSSMPLKQTSLAAQPTGMQFASTFVSRGANASSVASVPASMPPSCAASVGT